MIHVFKTNIVRKEDSTLVFAKLSDRFPEIKIHFDLEDCDHILRVEGENFTEDQILGLVSNTGFLCETLPD